jgi:hypothetical protein
VINRETIDHGLRPTLVSASGQAIVDEPDQASA